MPLHFNNLAEWIANVPARDLTDAETEQAIISFGSSSFNRLVDLGLYQAVPPTNLSAIAGNGVVNLSWTGFGSSGNYSVYRSSSLSGTYSIIASNVNSNYYTDSTVSNGYFYYYKVVSVVGSIMSAFSNTASALPTSFGGTSGSAVLATPGLTRWYSAQATGSSYNSKISSWMDLSGNNIPGQQALSALQPMLTNTGPNSTAILSMNVLDPVSLEYPFLIVPGYAFNGFTFIIAFVTSSKSFSHLCVQGPLCATSSSSGAGSASVIDGFNLQYSRNLGVLRLLYNNLVLNYGSYPENTPVIISAKTVNNGNNTYDIVLRVNGQQASVMAANTGQSTGVFSKIYINQGRYDDQPSTSPQTDSTGDGGNGTDEGKFSEVAVYNATLTDAQLYTIEHEIAARNGYTLS